MKMIEKIKMELKSVDFGEYPDNMNPDDNTKYNTYFYKNSIQNPATEIRPPCYRNHDQ